MSGSDADAFEQWSGRQKARMFTVFREDTVLYDSSGLYQPGEIPEVYDEYGNRVEGSAATETWAAQLCPAIGGWGGYGLDG